MNEETILWAIESLQTLLQEANNTIEELKEFLQNEINGAENNG